MAISITICNLALGDIRADEINDIGDTGVSAQMCVRYYPACLDVLLERHTWSFVTRLATLALLATNDRSSEWLYAYTLPGNMQRAMRLVPATLVSSAVQYWYAPDAMPRLWNQFEIQDNKLYTNVASAVLEYAANDIEPSVMPALFRHALRKALASELAVPLRDSREMKGDLLKEAELAAQRAVADDMNRQPNVEYYDEVGAVRRC